MCPKCQTENDTDANFCCDCGEKLAKEIKIKSDAMEIKKDKVHIIFISHAEKDKRIVAEFCEMLRVILCSHSFDYKIFSTSEVGCVECGQEINQTIHVNLNNCNNVFCILTENSYDRPWVMYEIGYTKGKSSKKNLMPIAIGIDINKIKSGYPYSKFTIYECDEQHLYLLMIQLLNNIIPNACNGKKELLKKNFAPHIKKFLRQLKK